MNDTSLHPLVALRAVRKLLDAPNDTSQVFIILRALRGGTPAREFRRFKASATGALLLRERSVLVDHLTDATALAALPEGTLGRAYFTFMSAENLSAAGLLEVGQAQDPEDMPEDARFFQARLRVQHDLAHVLTGYGRSPLGELCVLAFTFAQSGHLGLGLIVGAGMLRAGGGPQGRAVRAAVLEAWRRGRRAAWMGGQHWEALLGAPLAEVRAQLNIAPAAHYPPKGWQPAPLNHANALRLVKD